MHLATAPLWTEYVGAFAAVVAALVAFIALIIAKRSATSAAQSAELAKETAASAADSATSSVATQSAAEQQLALARKEHELIEADRSRKPLVADINPSRIENRPGDVAPARTVRIGFVNSGDRALEDALLTILVDPGSNAELTDRWGTQTGEAPDDETIERWPGPEGVPRGFDYFARPVRGSTPSIDCALHPCRSPARTVFSARQALQYRVGGPRSVGGRRDRHCKKWLGQHRRSFESRRTVLRATRGLRER